MKRIVELYGLDAQEDAGEINYSQRRNTSFDLNYNGAANNGGTSRSHDEMVNNLTESEQLNEGVSCREKL